MEAIELINWLLCFECASEDLRVVVTRLADWMDNPPPRSAYLSLMAYHLVAIDKRPGVPPMGIRETLCLALSKLVMNAAGDQEKTACGNLQL